MKHFILLCKQLFGDLIIVFGLGQRDSQEDSTELDLSMVGLVCCDRCHLWSSNHNLERLQKELPKDLRREPEQEKKSISNLLAEFVDVHVPFREIWLGILSDS